MALEVLPELSEAIAKEKRAARQLARAAAGADRDQHGRALKRFAQAQQRRRQVWAAMTPPAPEGPAPG